MSSETPTRKDSLLDDRLYRVAQLRLHLGELPRADPTRVFGGQGSCLSCSLCNAAILESSLEFEADYQPATADGGEPHTFRFHAVCYQIWDYERHRLRR